MKLWRLDPTRISRISLAAFLLSASIASPQGTLVIDDPLTDGTTSGVRDNGQGQFVSGGWRVTGASDNIRYTPATPIEAGAIEFDVTGLRYDDTRPQNHRGQLLSMYDASFGDPRHVYAPDLRSNPFKFVLHRYGRDEEAYFANHMKLIMNTDGVNQFEDYSAAGAFPWNEGKTYHMRLEWKDGIIRLFIDGRDVDRWPFVYRNVYRPKIHDIRIGTNTRNNAILDAVYSNVKIYDLGAPPAPPVLNHPRTVVDNLTPILDWAGEQHDRYEARVTRSPHPEADVVWESGPVTDPDSHVESGPLSDGSVFYAYVRLRNAKGWGGWSTPRRFETRAGETYVVATYSEHEIVLQSSSRRANPYTDVSVRATFEGPTRTIQIDGFWDGGDLYKVRVLPTEAGAWSWRVSSNDPSLNGQSGTFFADAPSGGSNGGYVRVSPRSPYTFEWAGTGEPFFLLGDTIWHMYYNLRFVDGTFQTLIDDRADQRFNYAHGVVHDFLANEGGPIYRVQDPAREMFDTDWLNPSYFHLIDHKIDYMNARGMVAGLFFSWGNEGYQEYESPEQYQRYIRYLVSRYATKNVFWIVVGEFEEAGEPRSRWRDYMITIANADPYGHPISLHTVASTDAFGPDPEHSFISQQRKGSPQELRALIESSRIYDKPVVNLEYGYEGDPRVFPANQGPHLVRRDHYALALAGGYGVYGNHTPWYSSYHRVGDFVLDATDTPGAIYLSILYDFFAGTSFHRLEPAQEIVDRGIAAAWHGREYVVQLPSGGSVTLDLSSAAGTFTADWFDPRTGARTRIGVVSGGSSWSFRAPNTDDWLLHVTRGTSDGGGLARIDLGATNLEAGLFLVEPGDGTTTTASIGGRDARSNANPAGDFYFYFDVNDTFHFEGGHDATAVRVDYFDSGTGTLRLQYDASDGTRYKDGGAIVLGNTGTWKSASFALADAWFGNRQNDGADFRIFGGTGNRFYLDLVEVTHEAVGPPGPATSPDPANGASGIGLDVALSWAPGSGARFHDVHFGVSDPPDFQGRQEASTFHPGPLAPGTTYFWRIDEVNDGGVTTGDVWRFTTADGIGRSTLDLLPADGITIDGNPDDWDLGAHDRAVRAGEPAEGNVALVGWDDGTLFVSGYATPLSLPTGPDDHTARVYARHDAQSLHFLARVDDSDIRAPHGVEQNWANDCVEIYLDPGADGGAARMNGSASDIQLVIDVANRANVYMTQPDYKARILANVESAVTTDASGWWLEVRVSKNALAPVVSEAGEVGLDFNFRDNDANNDPALSTVYTWSDFERSGTFPSKIPDRWARGRLLDLDDPGVSAPTLRIHRLDGIVVDGDVSDWNLDEHPSLVRAGHDVEGDVGLVGFDGGTLHWAGRATAVALPTSLADHTARIYARHDDGVLYFLIWLADDDIRAGHGVHMNWANDSVEIYLDPSADGGADRMTASTSDVQLVVDAANQANVYVATAGYRAQVLAGVQSAVSLHGSGWWCEIGIDLAAVDPDLIGSGQFGLDFNFRDNDGGNDPARTTVYTWSDTERSGNFPSKIPNRWGRGRFVP